MITTASAYSRRAARPWQRHDFLDRRFDDRPSTCSELNERLNVRMDGVRHVRDVLTEVLTGMATATNETTGAAREGARHAR